MEHEVLKLWLDFFASVIGSLAMPLVLIIAFIVLRKPIGELVPLLKRLKWKDMELEFADRLKEVKQEADKLIPAPAEAALTKASTQGKFLDLLVVSRAAAITEAWREVETAALDATRRRGLSVPLASLGRIEVALKDAGVLTESQARIYSQLRNLRNIAAHEGDKAVSDRDALAFADLTIQMAEHLRRA